MRARIAPAIVLLAALAICPLYLRPAAPALDAALRPAAAPPSGEQPAQLPERTQNPLQMSIEMQPPRPRKNAPFTLLVRLFDPAGKAVSDAAVRGTITLSTADRGRQQLDFSNAGGGLYRAETRVSTSGSWEVWLTASRGQDRVQQYTPFQVRP